MQVPSADSHNKDVECYLSFMQLHQQAAQMLNSTPSPPPSVIPPKNVHALQALAQLQCAQQLQMAHVKAQQAKAQAQAQAQVAFQLSLLQKQQQQRQQTQALSALLLQQKQQTLLQAITKNNLPNVNTQAQKHITVSPNTIQGDVRIRKHGLTKLLYVTGVTDLRHLATTFGAFGSIQITLCRSPTRGPSAVIKFNALDSAIRAMNTIQNTNTTLRIFYAEDPLVIIAAAAHDQISTASTVASTSSTLSTQSQSSLPSSNRSTPRSSKPKSKRSRRRNTPSKVPPSSPRIQTPPSNTFTNMLTRKLRVSSPASLKNYSPAASTCSYSGSEMSGSECSTPSYSTSLLTPLPPPASPPAVTPLPRSSKSLFNEESSSSTMSLSTVNKPVQFSKPKKNFAPSGDCTTSSESTSPESSPILRGSYAPFGSTNSFRYSSSPSEDSSTESDAPVHTRKYFSLFNTPTGSDPWSCSAPSDGWAASTNNSNVW